MSSVTETIVKWEGRRLTNFCYSTLEISQNCTDNLIARPRFIVELRLNFPVFSVFFSCPKNPLRRSQLRRNSKG